MDGLDRLDFLSMVPALKQRRTATDDVTECLRTAIQSGFLPDGAELNQVALAQHFGISRVPVREAMRALEAEGWITARPHHRAVVQAVSPERVDHILEVREVLEAHLIGKAIRHIDDERINALFALCDAMDAIDDHVAWVAANRKFHRMLLEASGSGMIIDLIEQLMSQVERYLRLQGAAPMRESQAGVEHRAILRAARARNVRKARDLIRSHIATTRTLMLAAISAAAERGHD